MNHPLYRFVGPGKRHVATGVAIVAGLLLLIGGTWRGVAAELRDPATHAATSVTTPIAHSIAGGRDSYADVVKVVGPAVVTIHTEGKASPSPTQFQMPNDDFFRRFFGNPGDQNGQNDGPSRTPRAFKQHALGSGVIVSADGYIVTKARPIRTGSRRSARFETVLPRRRSDEDDHPLTGIRKQLAKYHPAAGRNTDGTF
jgi:S1-C subfamily serine protease